MKIFKNILRKSAYALMASVAIMTATGCSSDDGELLEKYYEVPDKIEVEYGQSFDVFKFKGDDDMLVVPSTVLTMKYKVADESIVSYDSRYNTFRAVGLGSTTIEVYNSDEKLIRSIPVNVIYDVPFVDSVNAKYEEIFSLFKEGADEKLPKEVSWKVEDESIVVQHKVIGYYTTAPTFKAVGMGSTNINVYFGSELIKTIPVNVTINLPLVDKIDVKYSETFSLIKSGEENVTIPTSLRLKIGDSSFLSQDRYSQLMFTASGIGETTIEVYLDSELYQTIPVTVTPQATISIMSGQLRKFTDLVATASGTFTSSDSKVVYTSGSQMLALKAGTAHVKSTNTYIIVNVKAGSLTNLFPSFASFPYNATESDVDKFMAGYVCKYATESIYGNDGRTYYVKGYSPFGNCNSVDFFMEKVSVSWMKPNFKFAVIMTGKSSDEVLAYLCNTYQPVIKSNVEGFIQYFYAGDDMKYYKIYPEDGAWNKLKIKN